MDGEVEEVDDEYGEKMTEFIAVAETAVMSADDASAQGKGEGELWTRLQATKAGLDKLVKFFGERILSYAPRLDCRLHRIIVDCRSLCVPKAQCQEHHIGDSRAT